MGKRQTGSVQLTTTLTTNILNPPTGAAGVGLTATNQFLILKKLRSVNKTAGNVTVSLWRGATGANADAGIFVWNGLVIGANSFAEWTGNARFDVADFLVGGSNTATAITLEYEYELDVV